jgi:hypothetical protein
MRLLSKYSPALSCVGVLEHPASTASAAAAASATTSVLDGCFGIRDVRFMMFSCVGD